MRLVAVSTYPTFPPRRGGQIRTAALLSRPSPGWRIDSYSFTIQRSDLPWPHVDHPVNDQWTDHRTRDPLFFAWMGLCGYLGEPPGFASDVARIWPKPGLSRALRDADAVWMAHPHQYRWVRRRLRPGVPLVLDAHNIEQRLVDATRGGIHRRFAAEVTATEDAAMAAADVVLSTSAEEAAVAHDLGARSTVVVPNGVDVDRFVPVDPETRSSLRRTLGLPPDQCVAIMTGSAHRPNVEALELLEAHAAEYAAAGVTVVAVGRCSVGRPPTPGVVHAGEVPDVVPWVQAADIGLVPLVSGSGTSLKAVEFLAAGLAVVSTPVGVRGLELPDDAAVLTSAPDFVGAVTSLGADPDRRARIGAAGGAVARTRFSWDRVAKTAWDALDALLRHRAK